MTDHEGKAREVVKGHLPKMAYDSFLEGDYDVLVSAIASALREAEAGERERCAVIALEVAATMSEGYQRSHCKHCRDGEIGCHNTGHHTAAAIRSRNDE